LLPGPFLQPAARAIHASRVARAPPAAPLRVAFALSKKLGFQKIKAL
jgi:hypothetical protein